MKKIFFIALFMALILSACNMPNQTQPTPDMVATQVAKVLTEMPVEVITQPTDQPSAATDVPPTTEPTPTNTAEPTATPTPTLTHTPDTSDPAVRLGSPDGIDDFNSATGKWDYEDDWSSFRVNNGYLNVVSKGTPYWNSWYVTAPKLTDFYLEMVFDMPSCSGDDRIGLAFRAPDLNQFYILGITCNGKWGFERYTSNNDIVNILQKDKVGIEGLEIFQKSAMATRPEHRLSPFIVEGAQVLIDRDDVCGRRLNRQLCFQPYAKLLLQGGPDPTQRGTDCTCVLFRHGQMHTNTSGRITQIGGRLDQMFFERRGNGVFRIGVKVDQGLGQPAVVESFLRQNI